MKKSQFVLIVDDDRAWAEKIADLFVAYGYEAEVIANGKPAVEHARRRDFDIAFVDVRAADSCREVRQRRPHARVVLTGTGLLEKPLPFERMLEVVETAA
jgi:DNA-binding response OmpR family regulator